MQPGDIVVDRFEIESLAGSGGMGSVYRARDRETSEAVALKVLHGRGTEEPERFRREAMLLAELRHPGIVRYVAHGATQEGAHYLAMEWLEGEDLQQRIARAPLSVGQCITLVSRVAEALAVAHERGVIHRDIKPSNLFLVGGAIDQVKLLDFGIARVSDETQTVTQTSADTTLGTPEYMSPEQARGAHDVDSRTDIFSLGCVLFECLTGRPAFAGQHLMALLARVLLEEAPHVREIRPEVPLALDALVARMLAKDPTGRPRGGTELASELRSLDSLSPLALNLVLAPVTLTKAEQRLLSVVLVRRLARIDVADANAATLVASEAGATMDACRSVVRSFGGTLERLADGTLIATLPGTRAATDQAILAARCALALRALAPDAPMSLATGRGDLSAHGPVGEVIERAARLLRRPATLDRGSSEAPGPIRVDEVTAGLLDARFDLIGDSKGLALRGEREIVESKRTLLGREGPCVGRDRELAMLESLFDECEEEPVAHVALVTGAAGIGKSRLRYELLERLRSRDRPPQVWLARGDPLARASPFALLSQALRQTAGLLEGEPVAVRRQKLHARVARNVPAEAARRVSEFLGELAGTPFPDEHSVQLRAARQDAMLMGDQMRRAWEELVRAECAAGPLVIVLEDLHWGDLPTVSFVDAALRSLPDRPLMVLAVARPEVRESFPRLWAERPVTHIQLDKLTKKACERLVREFLGGELGAATVTRLVDRAAGNAFYLEEVIRSVAEGRGDDFPETVLAMVQARLEGLEVDARRVLRAASIFGEVFWRGGVAALLGPDEDHAKLDDLLTELVDKEVIARRGKGKFPGEEEFVFRHAQLREAALQMLMPADRMLGHRIAAGWLESAGESDPMTLAEHFERGGEPGRAVTWYRRAAEQALGGNDFEAVCARAERGIDCGANGEVLGALRLLEAEAHRWRGETAEASARGLEALGLLERGSPAWHDAAGEVAVASLKLGELERLTAIGREVAEHASREVSTSASVVSARARVAMQLLSSGQEELGAAIVESLESSASAPGLGPLALGWIHRVKGWRAHFAGDVEAHLALLTASSERFEEAGDVRSACVQRTNAGIAMSFLGEYARAEGALRTALAHAEQLGLQNVAAAARHALGSTLRRQGRTDEARAAERDAAEAFRAQGDRRMEAGCRIYLSSILLQAGDLDDAEREARLAVDLCGPTATARASALGVLAQVALARGDSAGALAAAREGMSLAVTLGGMEEGEAALLLVHAEALEAAGAHVEARTAIASARERLAARASRITDTSLRTSFLTRVAENARTLALAEQWKV